MNRSIPRALGLALALACAQAAPAQDNPTAPATPPAQGRAPGRTQDPNVGRVAAPGTAAPANAAARPINDNLFLAAAAASGMAEATISQLALERSESDQVRRFAQRMVEEHDRTNAQLREAAGARQVPLPERLEVCDQATADALSGLTGPAFDQEYARQQVAAHMVAVQLFRAEATRGRDPQLRAMAEQLLPHLEGHLKNACTLAGIPMPGQGGHDAPPAADAGAPPAPAAPAAANPGAGAIPADHPDR
jgi:putative membrane protein